VRGRVVGCTGPAAISLALALSTRAMVAGSWMAAVGMPMLGVEAAHELGVPLTRLVMVTADARPSVWAERVGAAADGFDLILTRPPAGADRVVRKVRTRLQARGVVLFAVGPASPGVSCDIEFTTTSVAWQGLGEGYGSLLARRAMVRAGGRRLPRSIEREVWLPGLRGGITAVEQIDPVDEHHEAAALVELERAG